MTAAQKLNRAVPVICIIGLVMNFIACYPGYMTGDSLDQFRQSLSGNYTNWHPPIMASWWRCLNILSSGPQVMLAFQVTCLWAGIYLLYDVVRQNKWWFIMVSLFAFAPFVQNFSGYIIKDSQLAIVWFLSCVWMLHIAACGRKAKAPEIVFCTLLLVYGCWIRLNALPGFIPLCFLWAYSFFPATSRGMKMVYALSFFTVTIFTQPLIQNNLLQAKKSYPEIKLYLHDLSGIFVATGENVFPIELYDNPQFDTAYIRQHYSVTSFDAIWWNEDDVKIVDGDDMKMNVILSKAWRKQLLAHPALYLRNRWNGLLYYLRIKNSGNHFYYNINFIDGNEFGLKISNNPLHRFWQMGIDINGQMPYMRPWFWWLLNICLLFFVRCFRKPAFKLAYAALVWSGILYALPVLFLFQVDFEFRYTYWNCIACSLAILLLIAERLKNERADP